MDAILRAIIITLARFTLLVAGILLIRVDSEKPVVTILLPAIGVTLLKIYFWTDKL